jgi:putative beta-lysine N-acetyltransferase
MIDVVEPLGDALVQHGPASDRVYVMKLRGADAAEVLRDAEELAARRGYGKVIAKCPAPVASELAGRGFHVEADVPRLFGPATDGSFVGKFLDAGRAEDPRMGEIERVLRAAQARERDPLPPAVRLPPVVEATPAHADDIAACYAEVFESYPFPIHDPRHVRAAMDEGTRFFTITEGSTVVAASSMEDGGAPGAVEMTDFATLPDHRGQGLARRLLARMDRRAAEAGVRVAFTVARALSFGMNITFRRCGYHFGGTLINNTQIAGSLESMNVWYRHLAAHDDTTFAQPRS